MADTNSTGARTPEPPNHPIITDLHGSTAITTSAIFEHCILFRVQNNVASVWGFRGWTDQTRSTVDFCASPVSGNPLELLTVYPNFHGAMPIEPAYVSFFQQLGLSYPAGNSLTPVEVNGRVVGILYGDCGAHGRLRSTEKQDLELARRLAFGFALILIKKRPEFPEWLFPTDRSLC